VNTICLTEKNS